MWTVANTMESNLVISLFKIGSCYSPLNYRPINLISLCCKCLEREIAAHCMNTLIQIDYSALGFFFVGLFAAGQFAVKKKPN